MPPNFDEQHENKLHEEVNYVNERMNKFLAALIGAMEKQIEDHQLVTKQLQELDQKYTNLEQLLQKSLEEK